MAKTVPSPRKPQQATPDTSPSARIDARIAELQDWRGAMLAEVRALIRQADPGVVEEWKWRGVPVWEHAGIICTGETYKSVVKLTFAKGAALDDPAGLFNSSLEGSTRRAIDIREGDKLDKKAFKALIRAAIALNEAKPARKPSAKPARAAGASAAVSGGKAQKPKLLSGGNPQIPKGYGDEPVQAYIAAMPGWKQALGVRLDALIERAVPKVRKAVKWNSPFYGVEEGSWFLSYHCFTRYLKVTFFRGTSLKPVPVGASRHPEVRYLDIHEDNFDEAQFVDWVKQASKLPGEKL